MKQTRAGQRHRRQHHWNDSIPAHRKDKLVHSDGRRERRCRLDLGEQPDDGGRVLGAEPTEDDWQAERGDGLPKRSSPPSTVLPR